jgi:hypothetical protein
MRVPLLIVLLTLTSLSDRLWSAQTDPFVGTGTQVSEPARNAEIHFSMENGQLRMQSKVTFQAGHVGTTGDNIVQFDGKFMSYPVDDIFPPELRSSSLDDLQLSHNAGDTNF